MPETRYETIYTYPPELPPEERTLDKAIITQEPYGVSDEQVYQEQLEVEFNDVHEIVINALNNWATLSSGDKDKLLKGLLKWALWKDGWLKLGVLNQ